MGISLEVANLSKHFPIRGGPLDQVRGMVKAVDDVSFQVKDRTTFGIAGESGSGKTTLCMVLARLLDSTSGKILLDGEDYSEAAGRKLRDFRTKLQIVFQNPVSSLDPHMNVKNIILEPLKSLGKLNGIVGKDAVVDRLLGLVGLTPSIAARFPHELSGGQSQRVAIARALSVEPRLLILDEPTSALDASVQAQILNLFNELQKEMGITFLLVSHDLSVIGHMCDEVAIMYTGKFVEKGTFDDIFYRTSHPYTGALLASAHLLRNLELEEKFVLRGEMPSPRKPPPGCTLNPRCPFATDVCKGEYPPESSQGAGHTVRCYHNDEVLRALQ
jgi:oligopeptide/dipeptide ABC transporter ATP-binding protein